MTACSDGKLQRNGSSSLTREPSVFGQFLEKMPSFPEAFEAISQYRFGGGELLLRSSFIREFCEQCPDGWRFTMETSLNVPRHHLEEVAPFIDSFIIDIKDMNPAIYKAYTGKGNSQVIDNLTWLSTHAKHKDKTIIRLPIIPNFNTADDRAHSRQVLTELGFKRFDEFEYVIAP